MSVKQIETELGWFEHANRDVLATMNEEQKKVLRLAYIRGAFHGVDAAMADVHELSNAILVATNKYRDD